MGLIGFGVAGRLGVEAVTSGPVNHAMSDRDASIGEIEVTEENTNIRATVSGENSGEHRAKITVEFTPTGDAVKKRAAATVDPGGQKDISASWDTAYFPGIKESRFRARIVNVESTEDVL